MRNFQHAILGTGRATGTLLGALLPTGDSIAVIEGDRIGGTWVTQVAARCPVHKTLENGVHIVDSVAFEPR